MSTSYDLWKRHGQLCFYCRLPTFLSSRHRMINYSIFVSTVKIRSTIIRPTFSSRRSPITNDCLLNLSSDFLLMTLSTYLHQITYSTYINYFFGIGIAPDSIFYRAAQHFPKVIVLEILLHREAISKIEDYRQKLVLESEFVIWVEQT